MFKISLVTAEAPSAQDLSLFETFLGISDPASDIVLALTMFLKRAMLSVQAYSNKGMLVSTIKLNASDVAAGQSIQLFQGFDAITSVTIAGVETTEYAIEEDRLIPAVYAKAIEILYTNSVNAADKELLFPVACQYAAALYDGSDTKVLAAILNQVCSLC